MKYFNVLANREFLVFVAIVASAVTWHVRQNVIGDESGAAAAASHLIEGRMCAPSSMNDRNAGTDQDAGTRPRALAADCNIRTNVRTGKLAHPWV